MATLDLNQLKAQVNKALGDASVVVKFSCATVCLLYLLTFADKSVYPSLAVTPGFIIPPHFRIWTLVTGCFTEYRIWNVVLDIGVFVLCGQLLEPLWGALEFLKFVFILDVGTSLLTSAVCVIAYVATFDTEMWFIQFGGMTGILAGMMVAFKQIKSEQELIGSLGLRIKHVPSIVVLVYCVLCIIGILPFILLVMANSGTLIGWVYLRFYQPRCKGVKGDLSDSFSYASFFPEAVQSPVNAVSTIVFNLLVRFNVCHKPVRTYDVGAPSAITISLPGMDPADAERRRQKALKALNDRLQKLEQNTSWPALDEPGKDNESSMASVEEIPDTVVDQGTNKRTEGLPTSSSVPT
ncbi:transmembrane protein 115-like [Acropora palmata]|uniref:transmembrane protein 115-like n=1 Tax=Acropora palmata TaxID=6131 RepID=UPI003D9FECA0